MIGFVAEVLPFVCPSKQQYTVNELKIGHGSWIWTLFQSTQEKFIRPLYSFELDFTHILYDLQYERKDISLPKVKNPVPILINWR